MTGYNDGYGYRYTIDGSTSENLIHYDHEVGALDAPRCIPAGAHIAPFYFCAPGYLVARRKDGMNTTVLICEWRI